MRDAKQIVMEKRNLYKLRSYLDNEAQHRDIVLAIIITNFILFGFLIIFNYAY